MIYGLEKGCYPDEDVRVLLEHDKEFSFDAFENMIINVSYPTVDDEDYVDEWTTRDINSVAEQLCSVYGFRFVRADKTYRL